MDYLEFDSAASIDTHSAGLLPPLTRQNLAANHARIDQIWG
jgi:hypothetical protein